MVDIVFRKATIEDLSAVQKLSQELFAFDFPYDSLLNEKWTYQKEGEEYFTKRITEIEGVCFVAELSEEVIGYATANIMPVFPWRPVKRSEMENMIVNSGYRRQGIGERLAKEVFSWSKSLEMERVMVAAYAMDEGATAFYKRIGFTPETLQMEITLE